LQGPDLNKLNEYSQALLSKLKQMPGIVDADTSLIFGKPELRARIDRAKAADLGVSMADVARSLRLLVGGDQVSTFNEGWRTVRSSPSSAAGISHECGRHQSAQRTVCKTWQRGAG
jgi:multidrug efflux pump subunit AcrB